MRKTLLLIVLTCLLVSCKKEPLEISFTMSSMVQTSRHTWSSEDGLTYKYSVNGDTYEGRAAYFQIENTVILEGGEEFVLEGWADNPNAHVLIETNADRTRKRKYNSFRIKN